jgi:hypothetical protein
MRWAALAALAVLVVGGLALAEDGSVPWPSEEDSPEPEQPMIIAIFPFGCRAQTDWPHLSGHVLGTINVTARTECPQPVPQIYVETQLYRCSLLAIGRFCLGGWVPHGIKGIDIRFYATLAKANSAGPCVDGHYRAWSYHWIIGPDGKRYITWSSSPTIRIACPHLLHHNFNMSSQIAML